MSNLDNNTQDIALDADFEILETNEATALEEMGASSTIAAGSTCSKQDLVAQQGENNMTIQNNTQDIAVDADFEILETNEATALEEMGASSTIAAGSTCSKQDLVAQQGHNTMTNQDNKVQDINLEADFEILETNEATALEEMGASSTISAGSTCSKQDLVAHQGESTMTTQDNKAQDVNVDADFEVLETNEATALEEMGASSTIDAGSTCSKQDLVARQVAAGSD
eukprot:TRINITY_DN106404_c0_g1_i1.p1 TRINITY_DN106404_c0_g1~~TRINITY_DN106404_c0_g1_i1.p1  ORF type:complete len:226 (-),score=33.49 TRINITY_DN106404_c0_g1_i1:39-716(-)